MARSDEAFLDGIGAQRIPDRATVGDFTRRFSDSDVSTLMDAINECRPPFWRLGLSKRESRLGIIDVDGTICPTLGEHKLGMDIAYNGIWGYHPLVVSLANTQEPLFIVNRSGNETSREGCVSWMDKAIDVVGGHFDQVLLRGDTAFSCTKELDRWTNDGVGFLFGFPAVKPLLEEVQALGSRRWKRLTRPTVRREDASRKRKTSKNVKKEIIAERGFKNLVLDKEDYAQFEYKPFFCKRPYRMIAVRKTIRVVEGQTQLSDDIQYLFYITNQTGDARDLITLANQRCNQENLIAQLKHGLNALRAPVGDLVSNWAYMVMASLAWSLKAWFALAAKSESDRARLLKMEFRGFVHRFIRFPAQIILGGRKILYRILGYNDWLVSFLETFDRIRRLKELTT
jgi:hypothetical protein